MEGKIREGKKNFLKTSYFQAETSNQTRTGSQGSLEGEPSQEPSGSSYDSQKSELMEAHGPLLAHQPGLQILLHPSKHSCVLDPDLLFIVKQLIAWRIRRYGSCSEVIISILAPKRSRESGSSDRKAEMTWEKISISVSIYLYPYLHLSVYLPDTLIVSSEICE